MRIFPWLPELTSFGDKPACDNCKRFGEDCGRKENDMGVNIWNDLIRWASWSKTFENRLLAIFCGTKIGE